MRLKAVIISFCLAAVVVWLIMPAAAQEKKTPTVVHTSAMPQVSQAGKTDWPIHNLDVSNRRYSQLNEINASNASRLAVKWSFDAGVSLDEATPLVIDGVMYVNAGSKLFAVNAITGESIWTFQMDPPF